MKEGKSDFKEGMTSQQRKTNELAKRINKKVKTYKTVSPFYTNKLFRWVIITTMVVSAALILRWLILLM